MVPAGDFDRHGAGFFPFDHVDDVQLAVAADQKRVAVADGDRAADLIFDLKLPDQLAAFTIEAMQRTVLRAEQNRFEMKVRAVTLTGRFILPKLLPFLCVEREEHAVLIADVDYAVADGGGGREACIVLKLPFLLAVGQTQRVNGAVEIADVDHAVDDRRRGVERAVGDTELPQQFQPFGQGRRRDAGRQCVAAKQRPRIARRDGPIRLDRINGTDDPGDEYDAQQAAYEVRRETWRHGGSPEKWRTRKRGGQGRERQTT
ncbi:MAG: hypothetical protein QM811_23645 [Pirellulales bacterium]